MNHADPHPAERHDLATAEALNEGGRVVVAGDRFERGHGLEEAGNLRAREVTEMEDRLDTFLAEAPAESRGKPITEAGQMRVRDHADLHGSPGYTTTTAIVLSLPPCGVCCP